MADTAPTDDDATDGEPRSQSQSPGEAALQAAIDEHGEELAAVLEQSDRIEDAIDTTMLILASAEEDDVEHVADALGSLIRAADGAATEETVALAEYVGEHGEEATEVLDKLIELDRAGTLDDLLDLGESLSGLDLDGESVGTLNRLVAAVEEAEAEAEPTGVLGAARSVAGKSIGAHEARAGLGFVIALLRSIGRTLVRR